MSLMQALRDMELVDIASRLQALVGAQLQEAVQSATELGLGFYHDRRMVWLWFDLSPKRPLVLWFDEIPPGPRPKQVKPILLFARAHLLGRRLCSVAMNVEMGRVLEFEFYDAEGRPFQLEARLFPHGANLTITADAKSIRFFKPKDVPMKPLARAPQTEAGLASQTAVRTWEEIREEWLAEKVLRAPQSGGTGAGTSAEGEAELARQAFERAVLKKSQAVEKLRADLDAKADPVWREAGEWAKAGDMQEAPEHLRRCFDLSKSLAWNIEHCFKKAKDNERKLTGTRERLRILESELADLRARGAEAYRATALQQARRTRGERGSGQRSSLLEKSGARGRTLVVGEDLEAYIGKSAADNLALLRRAQPHDLWLHLRDYPGAHAILRRPKGRNVTDAELNEVGRWVVLQSLRKSESELAGGRYDMILAECRHVRPIKGDALGRVHYQNDRLYVVRMP
ncbi:MAG: hypothetical protein NDI61_02555 [Bdellovibrionaceae bacterium]|nr:hypothetical protein [Pseudobdellovibrionaceae bacterium]